MKTQFALGVVLTLGIAASLYAAESKDNSSQCPQHPCPMMSGSGSSMQEMHKDMPHGNMPMEGKKSAQEHAAKGKVVAVKPSSSITVAHEPVPSIKWPAMTMEFGLASPDIVKDVKPGDTVSFRFVQRGKQYVVTHLEKAGS